MSNYKLYNNVIVDNDNTLKDFAKCVYDNCPIDNKYEGDDRKYLILESVEESLRDDISRTDINYEGLLYKYRDELGDLIYRMWDRDCPIPTPEFMGEKAEQFFNDIVYNYIFVHYEEFEKENKSTVKNMTTVPKKCWCGREADVHKSAYSKKLHVSCSKTNGHVPWYDGFDTSGGFNTKEAAIIDWNEKMQILSNLMQSKKSDKVYILTSEAKYDGVKEFEILGCYERLESATEALKSHVKDSEYFKEAENAEIGETYARSDPTHENGDWEDIEIIEDVLL